MAGIELEGLHSCEAIAPIGAIFREICRTFCCSHEVESCRRRRWPDTAKLEGSLAIDQTYRLHRINGMESGQVAFFTPCRAN